MKERKTARLPKLLRGAAIAAAMTMALAVTAGAVNLATDGELFRQFTIIWSEDNHYVAQDDQGNQVDITLMDGDLVTEEDGRLILHMNGEEHRHHRGAGGRGRLRLRLRHGGGP